MLAIREFLSLQLANMRYEFLLGLGKSGNSRSLKAQFLLRVEKFFFKFESKLRVPRELSLYAFRFFDG